MPKVASGEQMRSAGRLLQVLKSFSKAQPVRSLSDISRELDLAPSTVRRLLMTLEHEGFLKLDPTSGRYSLHYEVIRLASVALSGAGLVRAAAPILDRLNEEIGETVQLSIRDRDDILLIDTRQSTHLIKIFHAMGHRYSAYKGSAVGKVMLAWLPAEEVRALLPREGHWETKTERGIRTVEALTAALEEVRRRGYGLNERETEPDIWAVAAPIRDQAGRVVAALNVPCPESRLDEPARQRIIGKAMEAARMISEALPFAS